MAKLTNFEKWREYTSGLPSPDNYVNWSWYYTVGAALQRRVWVGPPHQACYPNTYTILVGPPGVGKGLIIREVTGMLKHWTLDLSQGNTNTTKTEADKSTAEMVAQSDLKHAQEVEYQGKSKGADTIKPLLIPVCADAITYEALVQAVGNSYRRINYAEVNGESTPKLKIYGHSSLCFVLQELSSLLRKRTNDTVNYLLGLYDCPVDYEYTTITRGKDRVRRGCLNIIAGTTPSFMQSTFDEELVGEGFTSRTFYIYANKNRKNRMWLPALTPEQEIYKKELLDHIKKLTTIYGPCKIEQETAQWLEEWWDTYEKNKEKRTNHALEMIPYYARKNIHVMKLAMALHFSEDAEQDELGRPKNPISKETFQRAINILEHEEKNMHLAIALSGNTPQNRISRKILELLGSGKKNYVELMIALKPPTRKDFDDQIELLTTTNQITTELVHDDIVDKDITYWKLV
jgi:hypothetical protein